MRKRTITSSASALLLFIASLVNAKHGSHEHLDAIHKRHRVNREIAARSTAEDGAKGVEMRAIPETSTAYNETLEKRQGRCSFPWDAGLVSVTPGAANAGWAMSPDQPCTPGNYCPYACPAGQVSMQWDPSATSYTYPKSMNGGLYCDQNGNIQKPFPDRPYCQATAGNIGVQNNAGGVVSFCQTVLPGNEAMLIPTSVNSFATLAVPDPHYWCGTAAHYYINPPGTGTEEACVWGTNANPVGNWSPYVAGANVDGNGQTFIKLGWNPIYLEPTTPFRNQMPNWGVRIDCPNGGCNGLPCQIDPQQNQVNQMIGSSSNGAGGGAFCVVTVAPGSTANFVVYNSGGSTNSGSGNGYHGGGSGAGTGGGQGGWPSDSSSSSSSESAGSSSGSSWPTGGNHPGQFFQSSAEGEAPSSTQASSETSTTPAAETTTTTQSSTVATTSAYLSSSSRASFNRTTSTRRPSHSPYFSALNYTSTAVSTGSSTGVANLPATVTPTGPPSSTRPSVQAATGAASSIHASLTTILSGMVICLFATL